MTRLYLFLLLLLTRPALAQDTTAYVKAYGTPDQPAIIFLHGGPGYNAAGFEFSTADSLARMGYFVIVYDQRGSGRSARFHPDGPFTFDAFTDDLRRLYDQFGLGKATLLGHSWGGTLATRFAQRYPDLVERLIFMDAPASYQMSFRSMQQACTERYTRKGDTAALKYMVMLRQMDTASLAYSSYSFMHAMNCGLYSPSAPGKEAQALMKAVGEKGGKWLRQMDRAPVQGLYEEERYTTLNLLPDWASLAGKGPVYGIFGSEDGLFDSTHLAAIREAIGKDRTVLIPGAAHNVFIDNQPAFLGVVDLMMRNKLPYE